MYVTPAQKGKIEVRRGGTYRKFVPRRRIRQVLARSPGTIHAPLASKGGAFHRTALPCSPPACVGDAGRRNSFGREIAFPPPKTFIFLLLFLFPLFQEYGSVDAFLPNLTPLMGEQVRVALSREA